MRFIAEHAGRRNGDGLVWGVEPICAVISEHGAPIAPSTYYAARAARPSAREITDEYLMVKISEIHLRNRSVYGPRKVWIALNQAGIPVARCTVERLMGELGLVGTRRGKAVRTTLADPAAVRPADLVNRKFAPLAPDRLGLPTSPMSRPGPAPSASILVNNLGIFEPKPFAEIPHEDWVRLFESTS